MNFEKTLEEIKEVMPDRIKLVKYCREHDIFAHWFADDEVIKGGEYGLLMHDDFPAIVAISYEQTTYLELFKRFPYVTTLSNNSDSI